MAAYQAQGYYAEDGTWVPTAPAAAPQYDASGGYYAADGSYVPGAGAPQYDASGGYYAADGSYVPGQGAQGGYAQQNYQQQQPAAAAPGAAYGGSGMVRGPAPKASPAGVVHQGGKTGKGNVVVSQSGWSKKKKCCCCLCCIFGLVLVVVLAAVGLVLAQSEQCKRMEDCGASCWRKAEVAIPATDITAGVKITNNWGDDHIGAGSDQTHSSQWVGTATDFGIFVYNHATDKNDALTLMGAGPAASDNIKSGYLEVERRPGDELQQAQNKAFCRQASSYIKVPDAQPSGASWALVVDKPGITSEGGNLWIGTLNNIIFSSVTVNIAVGEMEVAADGWLESSQAMALTTTYKQKYRATSKAGSSIAVSTTLGDISTQGNMHAGTTITLTSSGTGKISSCVGTSPTTPLAETDCQVKSAGLLTVAGARGNVDMNNLRSDVALGQTGIKISATTGTVRINGIYTSSNIEVSTVGNVGESGGDVTISLKACGTGGFHGEFDVTLGSGTATWTCPPNPVPGTTCSAQTVSSSVTAQAMHCPVGRAFATLKISVTGSANVNINFLD